jgi:hypothetical protein
VTPFAPLSIFRVARLPVGVAALLLGAMATLHAMDVPDPVTLDFPLKADQALPTWLGQPETPPTVFATLNVPLLTPDTSASLLVTVYFQEQAGGFMRVAWRGTQGAQLLSDDFYEDIGMPNQRSLLIPASTLVGDGILTFQCGGSTMDIKRIKLEWLDSKTELVSPAIKNALVTGTAGQTVSIDTVNGQKSADAAAAWQGSVVNVPLADAATRIEQGVDFSVDLDGVPGSARLSLKETGLPLGKHLVVWVNQQRAGVITPAVPDLTDDGFLSDAAGNSSYFGWREGSFYVPVALLTTGVNAVQFSVEDDLTTATGKTPDTDAIAGPLAVKDLTLQLNYAGAKAKVPAATTASTATETDAAATTTPGN